MKKLLHLVCLLPFLSQAQNQSFTVQDNLKSVTITPDAIQTRRDGSGFDSTKNNLVIGKRNLLDPNTHERNIAIGVDVLKKNGQGSTINGYQAFGNIGIGHSTLTNNTLGYNNIGIGQGAIGSNLSGYSNIAVGPSALAANESGSNNIALGDRAAVYTKGNNNIGLGPASLENLSIGDGNIGLGSGALRGFSMSTENSFSHNVGIGQGALSALTGGAQSNVALGYQSAQFVWQGNYNVALGAQTLRGGTTLNYEYSWNGSRNVCIGYQALGTGQAASDN
nr:hypothetical protein [Spirosomataceae bacterium]